jgi:hypothetical protein
VPVTMLPCSSEDELCNPWQAGEERDPDDGLESTGARQRLVELIVHVVAQSARYEASQRVVAHHEHPSEATRASQGSESQLDNGDSSNSSKRGSPAGSPEGSPSSKRRDVRSTSPMGNATPHSSQQPRGTPASARAREVRVSGEKPSTLADSAAAESQQPARHEQRSVQLASKPPARPGTSEQDNLIATSAAAPGGVFLSATSAPSPVMPVMQSEAQDRALSPPPLQDRALSPPLLQDRALSPPPLRCEIQAPGSPVAQVPGSTSPPAPRSAAPVSTPVPVAPSSASSAAGLVLYNAVGGDMAAPATGLASEQRSQLGRQGTLFSDAPSERSASPPVEERRPLLPASSFTSSTGTSLSGCAGEEVAEEDGFFPLLPQGADIDGCAAKEGVRAVLKRLQLDQDIGQADEPAARRVLLEATKIGQQGPLARLALELASSAAGTRSAGADEEHGNTSVLLGLALSLPSTLPFEIKPAAGTLPAAHRALQRVPRFLDALQLDVYRQLLDLPGFLLEQAYVIAALYPMLLDHQETHQRLESLDGLTPLQRLALHMALENKLQLQLRVGGGVVSQSPGGKSSKGSVPSNVAAPLPFDARSLSHRAAGMELTPPEHLLKECSWLLLRAPLASGTGSSAAPVTATGATPRRRSEAVADLVAEVCNELVSRWDLSRDRHLLPRLIRHHALQDTEVDLVRIAFIRRDETMGRFRIIDVMLVLGVAQDPPGAQADAEEVYNQCVELFQGLHRRPDELEHGSSSLLARLSALRSDTPVTHVPGSASVRALLASGLSAPLTPSQRSSSYVNHSNTSSRSGSNADIGGSAASAARVP